VAYRCDTISFLGESIGIIEVVRSIAPYVPFCHAERSRSIWLRTLIPLRSRPDLSTPARHDRSFGRDDIRPQPSRIEILFGTFTQTAGQGTFAGKLLRGAALFFHEPSCEDSPISGPGRFVQLYPASQKPSGFGWGVMRKLCGRLPWAFGPRNDRS
jgi:hypothetical protein